MSNIEEKFTNLMVEATQELSKTLEETMGKIFGEYLPWAAEDAEDNFKYAVEHALQELIKGNYTIDKDFADRIVFTSRDLGRINLLMSSNVCKVLAERHKDLIQNSEIKRLEKRCAWLETCRGGC